jgi:thiol-disulfide isomerase/thioredoxin
MASPPRYDLRGYFFYAKWCGPCKRVKPVWENLKPVYLANGITCLDYDYDEESTKAIMEKLNVKTVPTLVVIRVPDVCEMDNPVDYEEMYRGDSTTIPVNAAEVVHKFSLDEDF